MSDSAAGATRGPEPRTDLHDIALMFLTHAPFTAFLKDSAGRLLWVNTAWHAMRPVDDVHPIGRVDDELWPASLAAAFRADDEAVLRTGEPLVRPETAPHADGSTHDWIAVKFQVHRIGGDEPLLAGIAIDVTPAA